MPALDQLFAEVGSKLEIVLDELLPVSTDGPEALRSAMRWSVFGGGKHLRPVLLIAVNRIFAADDARAMRTAAAVEMIHTYSLIHDDLPSMDDDDLRRGRETCHRKFGEATAILAGDALQALAFQVIAEDSLLSEGERVELISHLGEAAARMVAGQQLDLDSEGTAPDAALLERIHRNKTGALIAFSADAGALIGRASPRQREAISAFSKKLGLLFQITDDLLDVTRSTAELGKTAGKDVAAAKATYPALFGTEGSAKLAKEVYEDAIGELNELGADSSQLRDLARFVFRRGS